MKAPQKFKHWLYGWEVDVVTSDGSHHKLKGVHGWRIGERIVRAYAPATIISHPSRISITVEVTNTIQFHGRKWFMTITEFDLSSVEMIGGEIAEHPDFFRLGLKPTPEPATMGTKPS